MAVTFGDLLQVIDLQLYLGQKIENVYYYRATEALALSVNPYLEVRNAFIAQVMVAVRGIQSTTLVHNEIQIKNFSNGLDFYDEAYTIAGTDTAAAGTEAPSYVSQGFKLIRETLATRNGYKRIAGLLDTRISGNVYTFPTAPIKAALELALHDDLRTGVLAIASPVIARRPLVPPVGSTYVFAEIGSVLTAQYLGSQNTRKPGRGD